MKDTFESALRAYFHSPAAILLALVSGLVFGSGDARAHGSLHETIRNLEEELEDNEGDPDLTLRLAELYREHGEPIKARAMAARVPPEARPEVFLVRARIEKEAGKREEARTCLLAFTKLRPAESEGWFRLATLLEDEGKIGAAAAAQQRGIAVAPGHTSADHFLMGVQLYRACGDPGAAVDLAKQAAHIHPRHIGLNEERALLLHETRQEDEGRAVLAELREHYPTLAYKWWRMEADFLIERDPEKAVNLLDEALHSFDERYEHRPVPERLVSFRRELAEERTRANLLRGPIPTPAPIMRAEETAAQWYAHPASP